LEIIIGAKSHCIYADIICKPYLKLHKLEEQGLQNVNQIISLPN